MALLNLPLYNCEAVLSSSDKASEHGSAANSLNNEPSAAPPDGVEFSALADNLPVLCWMAYGDGSIFWYNRRWYEYTGTTPQGQKGWGWQSVHAPDKLPLVIARWKSALSTGQPFEMTFLPAGP